MNPQKFKRFTATGTDQVILEVPSPYKIICGGVSLRGYALLTASFPESESKWICKATPLHRDASVMIQVLAFQDENSDLLVKSLSTTSHGCATVNIRSDEEILLCGGAAVANTCITTSASTQNGWSATAEQPHDQVTSYALVATSQSGKRIKVNATSKGSWRIHIEGVGDAAIFLGSARCQNQLAQVSLLSPPNEHAAAHPWKASPGLWRLSRATLPTESLDALRKKYCYNTKIKSPRSTPSSFISRQRTCTKTTN